MGKINRLQITRVSATWAALVVFIMATNPNGLPVIVLVVPYLLLYTALSQTWQLLANIRGPTGAQTISHTRLIRSGNVMSAFAVLLLIMQSVGQLTARDVLTLGLVFLLGYFYVLRMRRQQQA